MSSPTRALHRLASAMGVATGFRDGLGNEVRVGAETLVRVCAAMGAEVSRPADAVAALPSWEAASNAAPPVLVAWDGRLPRRADARPASLQLEDGGEVALDDLDHGPDGVLVPYGVHRLTDEIDGHLVGSTVIAAPVEGWRPPDGARPRWGVAVQLAALRSHRTRSVGDLTDLRRLAAPIADAGGDVVTVLPILPTFNDAPAEPSPYSPVSRLFWSEVALDIGDGRAEPGSALDLQRADAEVRAALATAEAPAAGPVDDELWRYARFRGAQRRLGRNWRSWPAAARQGELEDQVVDDQEERFHLTAQLRLRDQLADMVDHLDELGVALGLDLAVGVHPLGYDVWSRQELFAARVAVGAPPDAGFPSGQNWGFPPVVPAASAAEGHAYLRASIAHQATVAGLLRVDHIMAMRRLYWIPEGMSLDQGTYVSYPMDELFALLCLESHRLRCEIVGENLGTVPPEIDAALDRHGIHGMHLAQFAAGGGDPIADAAPDEVASIGTHDTPTFAGWLAGADIDERVRLGLLPAAAAPRTRKDRAQAVRRLVADVGGTIDDPEGLLELVIVSLGESSSPLVLLWLEDLWLEPEPVNVPGTSSAQRANWQRPMRRHYDEALADPEMARLLRALDEARRRAGHDGAG